MSTAAELAAQIAQRDAQIAFLAERVITLTDTPAAPVVKAAEPPPSPAPAPRPFVDTQLSGLAIVARDHPLKGSRSTWLQALEDLGRHLAPDLPPASQRHAALADPRGAAFVTALQQCR